MRTELVVGVAAVVAACAFVFAGGCGSSDSEDTSDDAGVDGNAPEAAAEDDAGDEAGQSYEQCAAMCATTHAGGKAAQDAVDACWQTSCKDVCVGDAGTFTPPDAGPDAAAPTCGTPAEPVDTGNPMCDLCTIYQCCTQYEACQGLADCAAYGTCMDTCDELDNQ